MDTPAEITGARLFLQIERELAAEPDALSAATKLAQIAATMMQADTAVVWARQNDGGVEVYAATDVEQAREHAKIVNAIRAGVTWDCLHTGRVVHVADVLTNRQWPEYADLVASAIDIPRSGVAFPLDVADTRIGALTVLSSKPNRFDETAILIGSVMADHAVLSLAAARTMDVNTGLRDALMSNRRIGIAIGVLITQHHLTDEDAFTLLVTASQNGHRKLRDVAEDVILTGALPTWPPPRPRPDTTQDDAR